MFILVEGCDKSGKSTIIKDIKRVLPNSMLFKNTIKPEGKKEISIGRTSGIYLGVYQLDLDDKIMVLDRSHITEIVYSARRGYSCLDYIDWAMYERELLNNAIIIYMYAPAKTIAKRFKTDNETYIDESEIEDLLEKYETYLEITKIPVLSLSSLNSKRSNLSNVVRFLANYKIWTSPNTKT